MPSGRNLCPVFGSVKISTGSRAKAFKICRYDGYPGAATPTRLPGSNSAVNVNKKPADDPEVTTTRPGSRSIPYQRA